MMETVNFIVYLLAGGLLCLAVLFGCFFLLERYGEQMFLALRIISYREESKKKLT